MATMVLIETERATPASRGKDTALRDWVRALEATAPIAANPHRLLPGIIEQMAQTCGEAPALLSAGESLTYRELAARANVFARWALDQGLAKGETVCLMMPNRPEYLAIWLGLTRVGVVVALDQHQSARCRTRPLHRHRGAEACHRRRRIRRRGPFRTATTRGSPENLGAWRRQQR